MELAVAEAKRAGDRGDYPIGAVITRLAGGREVVIASAGNRVKTSGSSIKHVALDTLKYVSSGYGRYLEDFALYSTHEPCAMCAGACVWSRIGAVVYGVSQEDIEEYGRKHGTDEYKWRACLIPCRLVLEKGNRRIPVTGDFCGRNVRSCSVIVGRYGRRGPTEREKILRPRFELRTWGTRLKQEIRKLEERTHAFKKRKRRPCLPATAGKRQAGTWSSTGRKADSSITQADNGAECRS